MHCNVCQKAMGSPIYESDSAYSVTSLCQLIAGKTRVFFCEFCHHLQTPEIENAKEFYSQDYKILISSDNEDQLYKIENGKPVYRLKHQAKTLLGILDIPQGAKVLDYGCAAAGTTFRLKEIRSDIEIHLFDVSDMYLPFWKKLTTPERWSTFSIPKSWNSYFDIITSYFSLEHIADLETTMSSISSMLVEGGVFYAIVPNWQKNIGDFIVIDHSNHFSKDSLRTLMERFGLSIDTISDACHENAFVVVAKKAKYPKNLSVNKVSDARDIKAKIKEVSEYWNSYGKRVRKYEKEILKAGEKAGIYGAGFYGTYIASGLTSIEDIVCFIDQSPFRQGRDLLSKKIFAPKDIPSNVTALYIGLNPETTKKNIENIKKQFSTQMRFIVL